MLLVESWLNFLGLISAKVFVTHIKSRQITTTWKQFKQNDVEQIEYIIDKRTILLIEFSPVSFHLFGSRR